MRAIMLDKENAVNRIALEPKQVPAALRGSYNGRRFYAEVTESVTVPYYSGIWSGGSRDVYFARSFDGSVKLSDTFSHPDSDSRGDQTIKLDPSMVVVCHHQGSFEYMTIYVHPDAVAKLLPAPTHAELGDNEKTVLKATKSFKSSYNGMDRYDLAKQEYGWRLDPDREQSPFMSRAQWDEAKQSLIGKGLLNKAGAITVAGRNAL